MGPCCPKSCKKDDIKMNRYLSTCDVPYVSDCLFWQEKCQLKESLRKLNLLDKKYGDNHFQEKIDLSDNSPFPELIGNITNFVGDTCSVENYTWQQFSNFVDQIFIVPM